MDFLEFKPIARYSRPIVITEKIDGMNCQIAISPDGELKAGVRTQWIDKDTDHDGLGMGFWQWTQDNKEELVATLGKGRHYGEWYGYNLSHGYGLSERRFALFNTKRWTETTKPKCCGVVPILYAGDFTTGIVEQTLDELIVSGSKMVEGWMRPEGIIIYHIAADVFFKKTVFRDEGKKARN